MRFFGFVRGGWKDSFEEKNAFLWGGFLLHNTLKYAINPRNNKNIKIQ